MTAATDLINRADLINHTRHRLFVLPHSELPLERFGIVYQNDGIHSIQYIDLLISGYDGFDDVTPITIDPLAYWF